MQTANAVRHTNLQSSFILLKIKDVKAAIVCSKRRGKSGIEHIQIRGPNVTKLIVLYITYKCVIFNTEKNLLKTEKATFKNRRVA